MIVLDDDDIDGRPAVADGDPLLARLIKVHKKPRFDLWHARASGARTNERALTDDYPAICEVE